jgi:O-antigen/teichoic acid export membrane protein
MGFLSNTMWLYLMYASNLVLPLIIFPYLARVLGIENFSLLMTTQSMAMIAVLITDYGFNWSASQRVAQSSKSQVDLSKIFWVMQASKALLAVIASFFIFLFIFLSDELRAHSWLYFISWTMIFSSLLAPLWFYQGLERTKIVSMAWILGRVFVVLATIWMVKAPDDLAVAAGVYSLGPILTGLIISIYMYIKKDVIFCPISFSGIREVIRESWGAFVGGLFTSGLGHLTTVILSLLVGPIYAGYFAAADRLRQMAVSVIVPLGQAIFIRLNAVSRGNQVLAWAHAQKFFLIQFLIGLVIASTVFLLRFILIDQLYGPDMHRSVDVLAVMAVGYLFTASNYALGFQGLISFGMGRVFWKTLMIGSIINVMATVILVKSSSAINYEISGAIGMLIAEIFVFIVQSIFLLKHHKQLKLGAVVNG